MFLGQSQKCSISVQDKILLGKVACNVSATKKE